MNVVTSGVAVGLVVTVSIASPAAAVLGRPLLAVRTYQVAPVSPRDWNAAVRSATDILSRVGIDVEWVQCSATDTAQADNLPARCTMPYRRNEVALRTVRLDASPIRGNVPLGDSLVDPSTHSGTLATIYLDRIERLSREARVNSSIVMARAIAHELGHLLMGTSIHGVRGLMRPVWTQQELVRNRPDDWSIAPDDGKRMRMAFGQRVGPDRAGATN